MEQATMDRSTAEAQDETIGETRARRALTGKETEYMTGGATPAVSSVLISSSKYLNNPYYRDTFAQFALRKPGRDLPPTYLIPQMVRALSEVRDDQDFFRCVQADRADKPAFAAWLDRRRITAYRPDDLRSHADGTLGATIRAFIEDSGMDIQFMKGGLEPKNDLEYIVKRRSLHHDIEHMVTGFGPSPLGEAALAVMNNTSNLAYFSPALAQHMNEAGMFVTATSLYRASLHTPEVMATMYEAWRQGIAAGQAIRMPLMLVDWEEYLDWSLEAIAADLGFARGPGGAWDYSSELVLGAA